MAERDDAGITEDEIQRDGEERKNSDLRQDQHLRRQREDRGDGDQPESEFPDLPAAGALQESHGLAGGVAVFAAHRPPSREKRPWGRTISTRIITA